MSLAQVACGTTSTDVRVEDSAGVADLTEALNCNGTVKAVWVGAIPLDATIRVESGTSLSIEGEDDLAEVQGSEVRLFQVSGGGLALTKLKLTGGVAESGGAILASSAVNVSIVDCVFEGNVASDDNGAAVKSTGGPLTIIGGEFVGNSANGSGGAVWVSSDAGVVVRSGTRFENNTATWGKGGGLYCDVAEDSAEAGPDAPSCSFNNVVFESNSGEEAGGALYGGEGSYMEIYGCTFEDNSTPNNGGAVVADSATLGGNTLLTNNAANGGRGGAVRWCLVRFPPSIGS